MLKLKFFLFLTIILNIDVSAQTLTPKEKLVFDDIVYFKVNPSEDLKISKWVSPIRYKLFGDSSEYIKKEIDSTFSQLKRLTGLDIEKTNDDDDVNFIIVAINDTKIYPILSTGIEKFANKFGGYFFKTNNKGEIYRVETVIYPNSYREKFEIRANLKRNIVKCLGFFNQTEQAPNSIFYAQTNGKLKIDAFDSHIISKFYSPMIKPGMDRAQVEELIP